MVNATSAAPRPTTPLPIVVDTLVAKNPAPTIAGPSAAALALQADGVSRPPPDATRPVALRDDLSNLQGWFPKSYDYPAAQRRVRGAFAEVALHCAKHLDTKADIRRFRVPGSGKAGMQAPAGPDREMDSLYLPAPSGKAERSIIISAGVHGAEGPAGTASVELFLRELLPKMDSEVRAKTNILVMHGINPWGYAQGCRFDHDGVDLNRQSLPATDAGRHRPETGIDKYSFESLPLSNYHLVDELFDQDKPLGSFGQHKLRVGWGMAKALGTTWLSKLTPSWMGLPEDKIQDDSRGAMGRMVQAMGGGQYENPEGVVYGGSGRQPVIDECEQQITEAVKGVKIAVHFCVHTGLGKQAQLHMIDNARYPEDQAYTQALLRDRNGEGKDFEYSSNLTDSDFYEVPGDFTLLSERAVRRAGAPGAVVAPVTYEFGTMGTDTQSQLKTTFALSGLNQMHLEGASSKDTLQSVQNAGLELFNPQPNQHPAAERLQKAVVLKGMSALSLLPGLQHCHEAHRFSE
jgi:hypothetical protein